MQLNAVLARLQADHRVSLVAGTHGGRTGRDCCDRVGLLQRRETHVPASAHQFRRVTAPAMSLCTRRATPRRLSANRRRDEQDSPWVVPAAGEKGHLARKSPGPREQRTYHRPGTRANNALKLTSLASQGGLASQLNAVLVGLQAEHPGSLLAGMETGSDWTERWSRHGLATESDVTRTT